jgi:hypothetical protein
VRPRARLRAAAASASVSRAPRSPKREAADLFSAQTDESCRSFGVWELLSSLASFSTPLLFQTEPLEVAKLQTENYLSQMQMATNRQ